MPGLEKEFVASHISALSEIPASWNITQQFACGLDLRMCDLHELSWAFTWNPNASSHDGRSSSCSVQDEKDADLVKSGSLYQLLVSLNQLKSLNHDALRPLTHLRHLDASLNMLKSYGAVEVLHELRTLNLSHNHISHLDPALATLKELEDLNLSVNHIADLSGMPALSHLTVLYLQQNKLSSLEGIEALSHLQELYVQNNQLKDVFSLATSLQLIVLNAADNVISGLTATAHVLQDLPKLDTLTLQGNPVAEESMYFSMLTESTNITTLDNKATKLFVLPQETTAGTHLQLLKSSVRRAFLEKLNKEQQKMHEHVQFLQDRIGSVQKEYQEYERKIWRDLNACISYLDNLTQEELERTDLNLLHQKLGSRSFPLPSQAPAKAHQPPAQKPRSTVTDTNEVLKLACGKLLEEQQKRDDEVS